MDRDNLRLAVHRAMKGKRNRSEVRDFIANLDSKLDTMAAGLGDGTYPLGRFRQFVIHDKKERIITAPCFDERVLHHGIMNVCEPVLDRWLIRDSYACRKGKGRIAALQRATVFASRHAFFLKLDIRKYFDSISHDILLRLLGGRFKDARLLHLLERIIRGFRGVIGRGLPIGSLMSQHFANFYLGGIDRFLKEKARISGYVRYMDDMALWADEKETLKPTLTIMVDFLRDQLALEPKPTPYLNRTGHGMEFLGCRVFAGHMTLSARNRKRIRRNLARLQLRFEVGEISELELQERSTALTAFAKTVGVSSWRFRRSMLEKAEGNGQTARSG